MSPNSEPEIDVAESLRAQIVERVKAQQQFVVVAVAVAGATLSFASKELGDHTEVMALLCLLYVGLGLAILRQDQEIAIIARHLLDPEAYPTQALPQARWELHKYSTMQASGAARFLASASQTMGNYGIPALAVFASAYAVLRSSPDLLAKSILGVAVLFSCLFALGAVDTFRRYRELGEVAERLLREIQS